MGPSARNLAELSNSFFWQILTFLWSKDKESQPSFQEPPHVGESPWKQTTHTHLNLDSVRFTGFKISPCNRGLDCGNTPVHYDNRLEVGWELTHDEPNTFPVCSQDSRSAEIPWAVGVWMMMKVMSRIRGVGQVFITKANTASITLTSDQDGDVFCMMYMLWLTSESVVREKGAFIISHPVECQLVFILNK